MFDRLYKIDTFLMMYARANLKTFLGFGCPPGQTLKLSHAKARISPGSYPS